MDLLKIFFFCDEKGGNGGDFGGEGGSVFGMS